LPALAALPIAVGIGLALGRWRGHRLDNLIWDGTVHLLRDYRLELSKDLEAVLRIGRKRDEPDKRCHVVNITALKAGAGTTTVALELAVALALTGAQVRLWDPDGQTNLRLGLMGSGRHEASGVELLASSINPSLQPGILVKAVPVGDPIDPNARTVIVLSADNRQALPPGALPLLNRREPSGAPCPAVPDDPHIQRAEALRESTLIAFPDAPASRTFRYLAASLRQLANR
jgi:cellulose biosynthesis protein BcsQ